MPHLPKQEPSLFKRAVVLAASIKSEIKDLIRINTTTPQPETHVPFRQGYQTHQSM